MACTEAGHSKVDTFWLFSVRTGTQVIHASAVNRGEWTLQIHVGPHKVVSSAAVELLSENCDHLAAQGMLMDGDCNCFANAIAVKNFGLVEKNFASILLA